MASPFRPKKGANAHVARELVSPLFSGFGPFLWENLEQTKLFSVPITIVVVAMDFQEKRFVVPPVSPPFVGLVQCFATFSCEVP